MVVRQLVYRQKSPMLKKFGLCFKSVLCMRFECVLPMCCLLNIEGRMDEKSILVDVVARVLTEVWAEGA